MKISAATPALPCMCASIRRASRAITQRYDEALRIVGLTITQFTILQALSLAGDITQGRLGEILAMDSTTLTRTLGIMNRQGWVSKVHAEDRRQRQLRLTRAGNSELKRATPYWQRSQESLRHQLGNERWNDLTKLMNDTALLLVEEGASDHAAI
jgi:DNA-binding MarR family transcriptional regulator